jgi:hypothetical protein
MIAFPVKLVATAIDIQRVVKTVKPGAMEIKKEQLTARYVQREHPAQRACDLDYRTRQQDIISCREVSLKSFHASLLKFVVKPTYATDTTMVSCAGAV